MLRARCWVAQAWSLSCLPWSRSNRDLRVVRNVSPRRHHSLVTSLRPLLWGTSETGPRHADRPGPFSFPPLPASAAPYEQYSVTCHESPSGTGTHGSAQSVRCVTGSCRIRLNDHVAAAPKLGEYPLVPLV